MTTVRHTLQQLPQPGDVVTTGGYDYRVFEVHPRRGVRFYHDYPSAREHFADSGGARMPLDSWEHFVYDLSGRIPPSTVRAAIKRRSTGHPAVDAVIAGRGEFLGKGNDGVVWRVGPYIVKGSTTVPYIPTNPGHRHPTRAAQLLVREAKLARHLVSRGVPGIIVPEVVHVGRGRSLKAFLVRPYLAVPKRLTRSMADQAANTLGAMIELGYDIGDTPQVGIGPDHRAYIFDLGQARRLQRGHGVHDGATYALDAIGYMYQRSNLDYRPPPGPVVRLLWKRWAAWIPKTEAERKRAFLYETAAEHIVAIADVAKATGIRGVADVVKRARELLKDVEE